MELQLRDYTIKPGALEQWLREWREQVVPLRRRFGYTVVGAWVVEGEDRFLWILGFDAEDGFEEADRAYYASAERAAVSPDPARHVERAEVRWMTAVV